MNTATKTFCFDLDGTLCTNTDGAYEEAQPFPWAIARVNALATAGHRIIIFTARGGTTGIDWTDVTKEQLAAWGVLYDELRLGKPQADVYIDDKALHVDAWRFGHGLESSPGQAPPHATTVVEAGRTFDRVAWQPEAHAERALALARAAGVPVVQEAAEIATAVRAATAVDPRLIADGDEIVFTIALSGVPSAAFLDSGPDADSELVVSCRLLSEVEAELSRYAGAGPSTLRAATRRAPDVWPLDAATGELRDLRGGELGLVAGGSLAIGQTAPPGVAGAFVARLAAGAGIPVQLRPIEPAEAAEADELMLLALPLRLLSVVELDDAPVGSGMPGPVAAQLSELWRGSHP